MKTKRIVYWVSMLLIACVLLFPFFVMLSQSFMKPRESLQTPVNLLPQTLTFENYQAAVDGAFLQSLGNTMFLVLWNMIVTPLSGYIVAYGFAKIRFKGSSVIFAIGMSTVMIPGIVLTIPRYVLYVNLQWLNTLLPFVIPPMFGGGMMNIFLIYNFLRGIPNVYVDAAKLDGASELRISITIIAPLAKAVLILIAVQTFIGVWNDFTGPLTYISRSHSEKWTLGVMVYDKFRLAVSEMDKAPSLQAAVCVIMMIPTIILFGFFQKTLINGVSLSGIKG